jgi:hypothetical protein
MNKGKMTARDYVLIGISDVDELFGNATAAGPWLRRLRWESTQPVSAQLIGKGSRVTLKSPEGHPVARAAL